MIPKRVRCPQCGSIIEYRIDNPSRPFCSERCKLIDLGAWAEERYSIPGAAAHSETVGELPDDANDDSVGEREQPANLGRRFHS